MNDTPSVTAVAPASGPGRLVGRLWRLVPTVLALAGLAGVVYAGQVGGWKLPKASALRGADAHEPDDWCKEHNVPDSACVECKPKLLPRPPRPGWNAEFGVHDSPFDDPAVAQTATPTSVTAADLDRARRALAFAPRVPNGKKCKLHEHRVQLASAEVVARLGIGVAPVGTASVTEGVTAPGEIGYDPTRLARLSARLPGVVRRVERQVGDRVTAGDVLALVDAAEVGRAKGEFQQALAAVASRALTLTQKKGLEGATVTGREVREAEAALEEAQVRRLLSEQALANLGLPVRADDVKDLSPAELSDRLRFLGIPDPLRYELAKETTSANLLPVRASFDGEVVARSAALGQAADPTKPLFVIADTSRVWLTLRVRFEDADRVKANQPVRFRAADQSADGTVTWVSPAADEKTRAVPVRVELPNPDGRLRAGTVGTAFVVLREEKDAVVVPSDAVHWEGCCHVVFVADRAFDREGGFKVFHVRKVRPGATDVTPAGTPVTEVIAGVLPGERVAMVNSGVLRSELLRNNLGAG